MEFKEKTVLNLIDVWKSGQTELPKVIRWSKWLDSEQGIRKQNGLMHAYSISVLAKIVLEELKPYLEIDRELVLTAVLLHDHGEGELKRDIAYIDKQISGDVEEYLAFKKRFSKLPENIYKEMEKAFLLQFCLEKSDAFPKDVQPIMKELAQKNKEEALCFDLIERWDYLLYALEQYSEKGNALMCVQVLRKQVAHLDRLSESLKGVREKMWTQALRKWCYDFIKLHEGKWAEKKAVN